MSLTQTQKTIKDLSIYRKDFPILTRQVNGKPLIYFDNAATSQKPQAVLDIINSYYSYDNSNIHRGVHHLSQHATELYEQAREKLRAYINASSTKEIIFTKGTTDAINLVAATFGRQFINKDDEVIITAMEHHSNIVPWQMLCDEKEANLKIAPINDKGELLFEEYKKLLSSKTKLVSVAHVSNSLGTINPVKEMIAEAHKFNAKVFVDGAQAGPHMKIDVQDLDCDFYAVSAHKMFGPTGAGILYGKENILEEMKPYQGGGDMIKTVTFEKTTYNELPLKFEAGTPHIEGGIAFGAAIDYINSIGIENINAYENELLRYATEKLSAIKGIRFIGTAKNKASVVSFLLEGIHPYDTGIILDKLGIAIRTGHHCTQPLMDRFKIPGTARISLAFYNTKEEIDELIKGLNKVITMFSA